MTRVLVVGGGPAGLATAGALRRRGFEGEVTVLEAADRIGQSWRDRYDQLRLHTVRRLSGLPGVPIPRAYGRWVSRADFVRYLEHYVERLGLHPELGVRVERVDRDGAGWTVRTSAGDRAADVAVIATGYTRTRWVPDWPGLDAATVPVQHSSIYRSPDEYAGRQVLVVGSGNSGTEIAVQLTDVGARVQLAVRTPPNVVRRSTLGVPSQLIGLSMRWAPEPVMNVASGLLRKTSVPDLTAYGLPTPAAGHSQFLRTRTVPVLDHGFVDRVRSGRIEVRPAVDSFDGDEVVLVDGSRVRPDAVIAATGFRPDLEPLVGHLGLLDDRGLPRVRGAQTLPDLPGLHVVGITVELSGLLHEISREAESVARALTRRVVRSQLSRGSTDV